MKRAVVFLCLAVGSSCGPVPVMDAGTPDASAEDAGAEVDGGLDAGEPDAGSPDAGELDAGLPDASLPDAGEADGGEPDSGVSDAGDEDAGFDAGTPIDAGPDLCPAPSGIGPVFRLRAMAANLTSTNFPVYTLATSGTGAGARIMQGADPDIVMIQEFNYASNSSADIANFVGLTFDLGFSYYRGVGNIPNGVISRWPIVQQGEWNGQSPDRKLTWAQVDIPGPNDLWVISVHMPTSSAGARNLDARTILQQMDGGIPEHDYVLLGGDFNTDTRDTSVETCLTTLTSRFVMEGPHPVDQLGIEGTSANRNKPYDHVVASPCLARLQVPTVLGSSTFDAGVVIDTRVYTPMSDIAPALATDSDPSVNANMQHMGVVKDFFIQP